MSLGSTPIYKDMEMAAIGKGSHDPQEISRLKLKIG